MCVPRSFAPFIIALLVAFVFVPLPFGAAARPLAAEYFTRVRIAQGAAVDWKALGFTLSAKQ